MKRDGVPLAKSSLLLVFNTMLYQAALLLLGLPCLFLVVVTDEIEVPSFSVGMLIYGFLTLLLMLFICFACMLHREWIYKICCFGIRLLAKWHLIKDQDRALSSCNASLLEYRASFELICTRGKSVAFCLLLNVAKRTLKAMPVCFLAMGLGFHGTTLVRLFALNVLCVIASASVPIPGTAGAAELNFTMLFGGILGDHVLPVMLTNRLFTFYFCVLFGGVWTWIKTLKTKDV